MDNYESNFCNLSAKIKKILHETQSLSVYSTDQQTCLNKLCI